MQERMKALICPQYGDHSVLRVEERPVPSLKKGEVLVKVYASAITTADTMMRKGTPRFARLFLGLRRPKKDVIGTGFSGEVVAVDAAVQGFQPGDAVFGCTTVQFGANAEFLRIREDAQLMHKPDFMQHAQACSISDGLLTSFHFIKNVGKGISGERILIIGASGSLGLAAIEIARNSGMHVTAVCSSKNEELVRSAGADEVLCYDKVSFEEHQGKYQVIFDTIGASSFRRSKRLLIKNGRYITSVLKGGELLASLGNCRISGKKVKFSASGLLKADKQKKMLTEILRLMSEDRLHVHVERSYRLEEASVAHQYIDSGRKRGNIVFSLID